MKKIFTSSLSIFTFILLINCHYSSNAQAYRKGSLLVSISEGSTLANYITNDISGPKPSLIHRDCIRGDRDPLIIEYAVSNRWGLGLTMGGDVFNVNSSKYYGFSTSDNIVKMKTNEVTFDCSYHVFVNKRLDLSVFASGGMFSVASKGNDGDITYNYTSNGNIVRYGTRVRYYFFKRFGAFGMISSFYANSSPKDVKTNTVANTYSTKINGMAIEGGLCFRILR
jgi:hypothetical protein